MSALPVTSGLTLLSQWRIDWIALALGISAGGWYFTMRHRITAGGGSWAPHRTALFSLGLAGYLWCTSGFPDVYSSTLFWVWSIQVLTLLLAVPVLLMAGQPVELAIRTARRPSLIAAACRSRPARRVSHPFIGPAIIPIATAILFFGHVAHLWTGHTWSATSIGIVLVAIGCLVAGPLTTDDLSATSLAVGAMLAISVLELLTDAIPSIVLRLTKHPVTVHFATRHAGWAMSPLSDQKLSGSILWGVAEMLDLPFLAIMFLRWVRTDEREAQRTDHPADRPKPTPGEVALTGERPADQPWWLTDPQLSTRPGIDPGRDHRHTQ